MTTSNSRRPSLFGHALEHPPASNKIGSLNAPMVVIDDDGDDEEIVFLGERPLTVPQFSAVHQPPPKFAASLQCPLERKPKCVPQHTHREIKADWSFQALKRPIHSVDASENSTTEKKAKSNDGQPKTPSKSGFNPFEEDSSEDEILTPVAPPTIIRPPNQVHRSLEAFGLTNRSLDNQAARSESKRLREEAMRRKQTQTVESKAVVTPVAQNGSSALAPSLNPPRTDRKDSLIQSPGCNAPENIPTRQEADAKRAWEIADAARKEGEGRVDQAMKEADAKRREEAVRRDLEKHAADQAKHDEVQKTKAAQIALWLKKREESIQQQSQQEARLAALSKLQAVNKATQARKSDETTAKSQNEVHPPDKASEIAVISHASNAVPSQMNHPNLDNFGSNGGSIARLPDICGVTEQAKITSTPLLDEKNDARQQRIKMKEEENRKKQQAEELASEQSPLIVEGTPHSSSGQRSSPTGPVSLHQLADRQGIIPFRKRLEEKSELGEITRSDIELVQLRDAGMTYSKILGHFQAKYNDTRAHATISTRYKQVKDAMQVGEISQSLIDQLSQSHENVSHRSKNTAYDDAQTPISAAKLPRLSAKIDGQVMPHDIHMLWWRDSNMPWQQIINKYERKAGRSTTRNILTRKYKYLKEDLRRIGADETLLEAVANNDATAIRILNTKIYGEWPLPKTSPNERPRDVPDHSLSGERAMANEKATANAPTPDAAETTVKSEHPEVGGKTLDQNYFQYLMEGVAKEREAENETTSDAEEEEGEEVTDEDYCHYVYRIQRREMRKEEIDEGQTIEDAPWVLCDSEYEELDKANKASDKWLFRVAPKKSGFISDQDGEVNAMEFYFHEGRKMWTLTNANRGVVQVQVIQNTRMRGDGILPSSQSKMMSRALYAIMQGTRTASKDNDEELFGEMLDEWDTMAFNDEVYSELMQANERAAKAFIDSTFLSRSGNLDVRKAEEQKAVEELLDGLDDDELFSQAGKMRPGRALIKIWVEDRRLRGPRNFH